MENLQKQFFYQMEKSIKKYRHLAQNQLKQNGFDITVDQWLVLKTLSDNPDITQNELADRVFKDKASITRIIDILVRNAYIKKGLNKADRRQHNLIITEKGKNLIQKIIPVVLEYRKSALKKLSKEEISTAELVLRTISENCEFSGK